MQAGDGGAGGSRSGNNNGNNNSGGSRDRGTRAPRSRQRPPEPGPRPFLWVRHEGERKLATENLVPGHRVYGEKLVSQKGTEYRLWDPFRSKLAAAVMNGLGDFPFANGSRVLYLGASTGTTVSHVSDMVGPGGVVFGVEHASRVARDFLDRVASRRPNVIPVFQDARRPEEYVSVFGRVDIVYADIAQPDQTPIAMANCRAFLRDGGHFFLAIKTRSIDAVQSPGRIIGEETDRLRGDFDILQSVDLRPYDKDHAMVVARYAPAPG